MKHAFLTTCEGRRHNEREEFNMERSGEERKKDWTNLKKKNHHLLNVVKLHKKISNRTTHG